jgi:hypothetical protein
MIIYLYSEPYTALRIWTGQFKVSRRYKRMLELDVSGGRYIQ